MLKSSIQGEDSDELPFTPLPLPTTLNFSGKTTTNRVYLVDMVDSMLFEESIYRLMRASRVGLVGKGEALGREGVLSLLVLSTEEDIFVFDILLLGMDGFRYGLNAVLHRPDLVKVISFAMFNDKNQLERWFTMFAI